MVGGLRLIRVLVAASLLAGTIQSRQKGSRVHVGALDSHDGGLDESQHDGGLDESQRHGGLHESPRDGDLDPRQAGGDSNPFVVPKRDSGELSGNASKGYRHPKQPGVRFRGRMAAGRSSPNTLRCLGSKVHEFIGMTFTYPYQM
eukprot:306610-Amorphochlora_amoeboformis.AAC.1